MVNGMSWSGWSLELDRGGQGDPARPTPNPRNLMGFLVAFKAAVGLCPRRGRLLAPACGPENPYHWRLRTISP